MAYNYWKECVEEAFSEIGIVASEDQITQVYEWVEGAYENYGLATGLEVASANHKTSAELELEDLKKQIKSEQDWQLSTDPCTICNTSGTVKDFWGRNVGCDHCGGKGRT
jgi:hypothetical protein